MVIHVRPYDSYTCLLYAFKDWWSIKKHRAMLFYVFHPRLGYLSKDWVMGAQQGLSSKQKWKDERNPDSWQVCMRVFWEWDHLSLRNNSIQLYLLLFYIIPGWTKREAYDCLYSNFSRGYFFNIYTLVTKDNGKLFDKVHTSLYTEESYLKNRMCSNFSAFRILTNLCNQGHILAKWVNRNLECILDFFSKR